MQLETFFLTQTCYDVHELSFKGKDEGLPQMDCRVEVQITWKYTGLHYVSNPYYASIINGARKRISLLGCNWLQKLRLDWPEIHQLQETGTLERILRKHPQVFKEELGEIN